MSFDASQLVGREVRAPARRRPAASSTPPPQVWKMSGGLPAWATVVSLVLKASFSSGVILIVVPVFFACQSLASLAQTGFIGSPVEMCHQSIVLSAESEPPPPPQAESRAAPAPAPARPSTDRREKWAGVVIEPSLHGGVHTCDKQAADSPQPPKQRNFRLKHRMFQRAAHVTAAGTMRSRLHGADRRPGLPGPPDPVVSDAPKHIGSGRRKHPAPSAPTPPFDDRTAMKRFNGAWTR